MSSPRGRKPVPYEDDSKPRMITWRTVGRMHRLLTLLAERTNTSLNQALSEILEPVLDKIETQDDNSN